ncbi:hypothetical protein MASR2M17_17220 [Aminivibrio sp.]
MAVTGGSALLFTTVAGLSVAIPVLFASACWALSNDSEEDA